MDAKKVLSVLDIYGDKFVSMSSHASLQGLKLRPERADASTKYDSLDIIEQMVKLSHVWWAVEQCRIFVNEGRMEKAFRWLGFIQGALWHAGIYSVEEMANHNKPPEEPTNLDPNRKPQE